MRRLNEILPGMTYDMCVLTGDYRGATFGPFDAALEGLARARAQLKAPVYAVLGNHDPFGWCPHSKKWESGYCSTNASQFARRRSDLLAGIDDAHYYRVDNIEKAAAEIPDGEHFLFCCRIHLRLPPGCTCRL